MTAARYPIYLQIDKPYADRISRDRLEQAVIATLQHQQVSLDSALSIVITGDEAVRQLNLQYRDIDEPTDVLSFPQGERNPETGELYLGDVVIACPQAELTAQQGRHALIEELSLLAVHGTLHLLDFDHDTAAKKAAMWRAQEEILSAIGCEIRPP